MAPKAAAAAAAPPRRSERTAAKTGGQAAVASAGPPVEVVAAPSPPPAAPVPLPALSSPPPPTPRPAPATPAPTPTTPASGWKRPEGDFLTRVSVHKENLAQKLAALSLAQQASSPFKPTLVSSPPPKRSPRPATAPATTSPLPSSAAKPRRLSAGPAASAPTLDELVSDPRRAAALAKAVAKSPVHTFAPDTKLSSSSRRKALKAEASALPLVGGHTLNPQQLSARIASVMERQQSSIAAKRAALEADRAKACTFKPSVLGSAPAQPRVPLVKGADRFIAKQRQAMLRREEAAAAEEEAAATLSLPTRAPPSVVATWQPFQLAGSSGTCAEVARARRERLLAEVEAQRAAECPFRPLSANEFARSFSLKAAPPPPPPRQEYVQPAQAMHHHQAGRRMSDEAMTKAGADVSARYVPRMNAAY